MEVEAEIKNLSFLTPQGLNGRQGTTISVVVHTPSTGCAVVTDLTLQKLRDAADDGDRIRVFDLVSSDDTLCREGEREARGSKWQTRFGAGRLGLALRRD